MKNRCFFLQVTVLIILITQHCLAFGIAKKSLGLSYRKVGDIGYTKRIECVLPEKVGHVVMMSYVPTTGFYKGYKQRLLIMRSSDLTYNVFLKDKKSLFSLISQYIYVAPEHKHKINIEIEPSGDVYLVDMKDSNNKNRLVSMAQAMPFS